MLATTQELSKFSNNYDSELMETYIRSAGDIISKYVGYDPETFEEFEKDVSKDIYVYSEDGENFFEDKNLHTPAVIPEGVTPQRTLEENEYYYTITTREVVIPQVFKLVCLEIATLLMLEENQNLGINNKSFGESGSRTFLNITNYDAYLKRLSTYKRKGALKF